jgi:hypothetical protein
MNTLLYFKGPDRFIRISRFVNVSRHHDNVLEKQVSASSFTAVTAARPQPGTPIALRE